MWLNLINVILVSTLIITPQVFDDKDPSDDRGENTTKRYYTISALDDILMDLSHIIDEIVAKLMCVCIYLRVGVMQQTNHFYINVFFLFLHERINRVTKF